MRNLYRVEDGGETHHYSAASEDQVIEQHYGNCGMACGCSREDCPIDSIEVVPDDKVLRVREDGTGEIAEKTAREWADTEEGLVSSTIN